ncbi:MAG: GNAT family N-acetyltransferase [Mangrovibacterium sp.]
MKKITAIQVVVANVCHLKYTTEINDTIDVASKERGTGIARRTNEYINSKILEGKAIIAMDGNQFAGFCYIESWGHNRFVANSGLIVKKEYRGMGLAKEIKEKAFELSRRKFPDAKIFGLTTGLAVMKINHELGYRPVTFSELTDDEDFWKGCRSCVNYDILQRTNRTKCLCTGMLFDPAWGKGRNAGPGKSKKVSLLEMIGRLRTKNGNNAKEQGTGLFRKARQA